MKISCKAFLVFSFLLPPPHLMAQGTWRLVRENKQVSFPSSVPAGKYSGLAPMGDGHYAVVNDKAPGDGFSIMKIDIDSLSGEIKDVYQEVSYDNGMPSRDAEGIVFIPSSQTVWISGEKDNAVLGYTVDGRRTGDSLSLPVSFREMSHLYGLESLAYDSVSHTFYTANESTLTIDGEQATATNGVANRVRIVAIKEGKPFYELTYLMDAPLCGNEMQWYAMGVSELMVLPDGQLLVLERELAVPKKKIGAFVNCKLYVINPANITQGHDREATPVEKELLFQWKTKLNITARDWANYEGMCLGPQLADGSWVVILVSDSQDQYAGVLKDWWKTLVIAPVLP